jgi:hypothetical protein
MAVARVSVAGRKMRKRCWGCMVGEVEGGFDGVR